MAQGLTLQQLQAKGATPVASNQSQSGGLTLQELQSKGATPSSSAVKPTPYKYDVPENKNVKMSRISNENAEYEAKAKKDNSVGAKISAVARNLPIIGSAIKVGETLGQSLAAPSVIKNLSETDKQKSDIKLNLVKQIQVLRSQGKDTSRLEQAYNMLEDEPSGQSKIQEIVPKSQMSTGKAVGELGELALDTLTAGTYGAGAKTATKTTAPTIVKALRSGTAKSIAGGAAIGEGYDVAQNLQEGKTGSDVITDGYGKYAGAAIPAVFGASKIKPRIAEKQATNRGEQVDELLGRVTQGEKENRETYRKAFGLVDGEKIKNAKTYDEAVSAFDDRVGEFSQKLDAGLDTKTDKIPLANLNSTKQVGGKTVNHNFVTDALDQLDDFYKKTNNPTAEAEILILKNKAETEGLTVREINDLARKHGKELNAFNANGELASGLKKQAAENTRKGLKDTARGLFGDQTYADTDDAIASLIKTRDALKDVAGKVTELQQKIIPRKFGQKTARAILNIMDKLTNGTLRGVAEWAIPRGEGNKVLNALDLEKQLPSLIKRIRSVIDKDLPDETIIQKLEAIVDGANKPKLALPAPREGVTYGQPQNPIKVAPKGAVMESTGKDPFIGGTNAPEPKQSKKSLDRRQSLVNALRGEYEGYTPNNKLPTIDAGETPKPKKSKEPEVDADSTPNVFSPESEYEAYTPPEQLPVIQMGKKSKKKGLASVGTIMAGGAATAGAPALTQALRGNGKEAQAQTVEEKVQPKKENKKNFVPENFIDILVDQESSNGKDKRNEKYDQGKYGWLVGFTKGTYADIKEKAKTSERYKNLYAQMKFDTPEQARASAEAYAHFLMRDFGTKGALKDGTTPKNIDAKELYRLYNGNGSPEGVESFGKKYEALVKARNES